MRVLVTGANGFIGRHVTACLRAQGIDYVALDRRTGETSHPRFIQADIRLPFLRDLLRHTSITHVIHLAAITDLRAPAHAHVSTNFWGTINLLCALPASAQTIIFASTQLVQKPWGRQSVALPLDPYGPYGASKALAECWLRANTRGMRCLILRLPFVWGPGHLGFATAQLWHIEKGTYLHPRGTWRRLYCYVETCARALVGMLVAEGSDRADWSTRYLVDEWIDSGAFLDRLSIRLSGRPVRRVPAAVLRAIALLGAIVPRMAINPARYRRMTGDQVIDVNAECVPLQRPWVIDPEEAVDRTILWYQNLRRAR